MKNIYSDISPQLICNVIYYKNKETSKKYGETLGEYMSNNTPWSVYPRPQMKRELYKLLNGKWTVNGSNIIVPFPPQSALSDYSKSWEEVEDELVYECDFAIPESFVKDRILLHFGAVDQVAQVYVDGEYVGKHEGGYLPFYFDVTNQVFAYKDKTHHLRVVAIDTLSKNYPYGKQCRNRGGMWYTPVSGIWQSVWLENVPNVYIDSLAITPDMQGVEIEVCTAGKTCCTKNENLNVEPVHNAKVCIFLENGDTLTKHFEGGKVRIDLSETLSDNGNKINLKLWDMDNPYIYDMKVQIGEDEVASYFALRKIEIIEVNGINRVCLNGKPIFLNGVLDQGYFADGIYLPEEFEEYERDILRMKELGINVLRKHIKIEPEIFYYYCDKHGMLVMQDMVNSGPYSFIKDTALPTVGFKRLNDRKRKDKTNPQDDFRKKFFEQHMRDTIKHLYNHPSVVLYTIFNEGWGQFDSDRMYEIAKELDATRLYDSTSGWFAGSKSDFDSEHVYFRNKKLKPGKRPMLLSECGGFTYKVDGHCYNPDKSYGYGACKSSEELTDRIIDMYEKMVFPAIKEGLCGVIYTQLSDVEDEINGLYTYDRKVCKVDKEKMCALEEKICQICKEEY